MPVRRATMDADTPTDGVLDELFVTIKSRKVDPPEDFYTTTLSAHERGGNCVLGELGEEMTEITFAARNDDGEELPYKSADSTYRLLVLPLMKDVSPDDLRDELKAHF